MTDRPFRNVVPLRRGITPPAERTVVELGDTVVEMLFGIGLHLQHVTPTAGTTQAQHLRAALDQLDELIRSIRKAAFATARANHPSSRATPRTDVHTNTTRMSLAPAGRDHADVDELLDQSEFLHHALRRVTGALASTEERIADAFERLAAADGPRHEEFALTAKRARVSALHYRDIVVD